MSHVTDVLLLGYEDCDEGTAVPAIQFLENWLARDKATIRYENSRVNTLTRVDQLAGGSKVMQATVWAGAYNYLDIEGFLSAIWAAPWTYPEDVQVLLKDEHENRWTLYDRPVSDRPVTG